MCFFNTMLLPMKFNRLLMIPDYQSLMLPILRSIDKKPAHYRDLAENIAEQYGLTAEEAATRLPSGKSTVLYSRVYWSAYYMKRAGYVDISRGMCSITDAGVAILRKNPTRIDRNFLYNDSEMFRKWMDASPAGTESSNHESSSQSSPAERMDSIYLDMRGAVEEELLGKIKENSPSFFERVIPILAENMGYAGKCEVLGRSGDGGIDGRFGEDKLSLDYVYFQAKRYGDNPVPLSAVRDFAGALTTKQIKKGIFVTSSKFPDSAYEFVKNSEFKITLIDGKMLAKYMYDHNVGVDTKTTYEIKKVNHAFFDDI